MQDTYFFYYYSRVILRDSLYEYGIREEKARRQSHVLVMSNSPKTRDPTSSKNIRWKKHDLLKKYTSQKEASRIDIGSDGLPAERLMPRDRRSTSLYDQVGGVRVRG